MLAHENSIFTPTNKASFKVGFHLSKNQGLISPNFVRQAKSCQRTAFGKKFAIQFHQNSALKLHHIM